MPFASALRCLLLAIILLSPSSCAQNKKDSDDKQVKALIKTTALVKSLGFVLEEIVFASQELEYENPRYVELEQKEKNGTITNQEKIELGRILDAKISAHLTQIIRNLALNKEDYVILALEDSSCKKCDEVNRMLKNIANELNVSLLISKIDELNISPYKDGKVFQNGWIVTEDSSNNLKERAKSGALPIQTCHSKEQSCDLLPLKVSDVENQNNLQSKIAMSLYLMHSWASN